MVKLNREVKIGMLFLVALGLLYWGVTFLKGSSLFSQDRKFYALYERVEGLQTANPVVINGLEVGQVTSLELLHDGTGRILVAFVVSDPVPIARNTVAEIYSSDLLGSKSVNLKLGNASTFLQSGDTLQSAIQRSLQEEVNAQVQPLKKKAEDLMLSVDTMVTAIQGIFNETARENLTRSFASIRNTIAQLESTTHNIDTLISAERQSLGQIIRNLNTISGAVADNSASIEATLQNISAISDSVAQIDFTTTLRNTNQALQEFSSIMHKVDAGKGSLGQFINNDSLYQNMEAASRELNLLLLDMKLHPKRYVHFSVFGRGDKRNQYQPAPDSLAGH